MMTMTMAMKMICFSMYRCYSYNYHHRHRRRRRHCFYPHYRYRLLEIVVISYLIAYQKNNYSSNLNVPKIGTVLGKLHTKGEKMRKRKEDGYERKGKSFIVAKTFSNNSFIHKNLIITIGKCILLRKFIIFLIFVESDARDIRRN